jgi:hypothetical protein
MVEGRRVLPLPGEATPAAGIGFGGFPPALLAISPLMAAAVIGQVAAWIFYWAAILPASRTPVSESFFVTASWLS